MAKCPNCGVKIGIFDWRPNCKECGVNLVYFDIEKRLLADSERAEAEHRDFVRKTARVKSAFIGGAHEKVKLENVLAILRIVLSLVPIAMLLLPLFHITTKIPLYENALDLGAIQVYEVVSTLNFGGLFAALGSDIVGTPSLFLLLSMVTTVLMVLGMLLNLILISIACSPKGKVRSLTVASITVVMAVLSVVFFYLSGAGYAAIFPGAYSVSIGIGSYLTIAALLLTLGINVLLFTKKFQINVIYPEIIPLGYKKPKKAKKKSPLDKLFKKNKKGEEKKEKAKK